MNGEGIDTGSLRREVRGKYRDKECARQGAPLAVTRASLAVKGAGRGRPHLAQARGRVGGPPS